MKSRGVDRALLEQLNAHDYLDSDDQLTLIARLGLLNDETFAAYLALVNVLAVVQALAVLVLRFAGVVADGWLQINLEVNTVLVLVVLFNRYFESWLLWAQLGLLVVNVGFFWASGSWLHWLPLVTFAMYSYLYYSFSETKMGLAELSKKRYKYKDV